MRVNLNIAYLLWFLSGFGVAGFHRFYLGKIRTGFLWMITGGCFFVGALYDLATMPRQVDEANFRLAYKEQLRLGRGPEWRAETVQPKERVERVALRVARARGGIVTAGEVALEGDCSLEEAKGTLDKLAASGSAEMRIRSSGVVAYVFPEFAEDRSGFVV